MQLGYEDVPERKLTKPEKGHLDKAGVSPALELLAAVLVLVDGPEDGDNLLLGGQGDGTGDGSAGALGGLDDLVSGLVDDLMIVGLQANADRFFCHLLVPPCCCTK